MRNILAIGAFAVLAGVVALPAVAGSKIQPKVDIAGTGTASFTKVDNGDLHCSATLSDMTAGGPGNFTFTTAGRVNTSFNPTLSRWEFDFGPPPGGRVDIEHAKDNSLIDVFTSSPTHDMYMTSGGCGFVTVVGDGTLRVGKKVWTGLKVTPVTKGFKSVGANCQ